MSMKLLFLSCLLLLSISCNSANQVSNLNKLIKSQRYQKPLQSHQSQDGLDQTEREPFPVSHDFGSKEADKVDALPGQPTEGVDFDQYAGYVTIDATAGRALFYYFVESPQNSSTNPLVLWLNGGPGCSSLGYGAMEELGPFRVNGDGVSLYKNDYAWNNEANVLFLESPAGVGFSYSNTTYHGVGDNSTAADSYKFLINWLEKFPEYKKRDFYITGESYAGHYVPQLANTIVSENKIANQTIINLKGIAIGNAWIDATTGNQGAYDYLWTHALNSDETNAGIKQYCDFVTFKISDTCETYMSQSDEEVGDIDPYNVYAPLCSSESKSASSAAGSVYEFDPCSDNYVNTYLNLPEVQAALHARPTQWSACGDVGYTDSARTVLPIIQDLIASGIRVWIYSGDVDSVVAVTTTRYAINTLNLKTKTPFRAWYSSAGEVGGYVIVYDGLVFATVRGAGHEVPSYQPERALTLFSAFIQGTPLPSS